MAPREEYEAELLANGYVPGEGNNEKHAIWVQQVEEAVLEAVYYGHNSEADVWKLCVRMPFHGRTLNLWCSILPDDPPLPPRLMPAALRSMWYLLKTGRQGFVTGAPEWAEGGAGA